MTFHLLILYINFSSVKVAVCPTLGKYHFIWLTICSLCILTINNLSYFPFLFSEQNYFFAF